MDIPGRAVTRPAFSAAWPLRPPDVYLHAVATEDGLRLDGYPEELIERPPMADVLAADRGAGTVA